MDFNFSGKNFSKFSNLSGNNCLILFLPALALAYLGFAKLKLGLAFIDEGMYLTDAWRLAVGDSFFPDSSRFPATFYSWFTSIFFRIEPRLSVLDVRIIQLCMALLSFYSVVLSIWKRVPRVAVGSLILTFPFLVLGLDTMGRTSSLSYNTVPNFFFIILFSLYLNYAFSKNANSIWVLVPAVSIINALLALSYLPASLTYLSTILLFRVFQPHQWMMHALTLPIGMLVILTALGPDPGEWARAHIDFLTVTSGANSKGFSPWTVTLVAMAALAFLICVRSPFEGLAKVFKNQFRVSIALAVVIVVFFSWGYISSFSGLMPPVYRGWFDIPGILVIANLSLVFLSLHIAWRIFVDKSVSCEKEALFATIGILYYFIFSLSFALTSQLGILQFCLGTFVLWSSFLLLAWSRREFIFFRMRVFFVGVFISASIALPLFDWSFTYFDLPPEFLDTEIQDGPARGIHTSKLNADLDKALRKTIEKYTEEDDFILSWEQAPMAYFLGQRRPAIDHSWVGITKRNRDVDSRVLKKMVSAGREPKLAIFWANKFLFFPSARGSAPQYSAFSSMPESEITNYVRRNMFLVDQIQVNGMNAVEFYLRNED